MLYTYDWKNRDYSTQISQALALVSSAIVYSDTH